MEKLDPKTDGSTVDIVQQNLDKLKELFPGVFTEGKVDFDALRETLGDYVDDRPERYSFTWNGKSRARRIAQTPSTGTLRPCPEESVNWDTTRNLFIEGDNLEVLKLLQKSYHKKVKMIYIDPPYNTGKEFIYPDKFQDNLDTYLRYTGQIDDEGLKLSANTETSGRYHTNWLNMMLPRLKLARNLLRDDGVIFITIDDTEASNLRKLCDEVFGEENFVANIVWQKKQSPQSDATYFSDMHDHILVYAKHARTSKVDSHGWARNLFPRGEQQNSRYRNPDDDPRGPWTSVDLTCNKTSDERPNLFFPVVNPNTGEEVWPTKQRVWGYEPDRMQTFVEEDRISWGASGTSFPRGKRFLSEVADGIVPSTWWGREDFGDNQGAAREVQALFQETYGVFDTPKPTRLIKAMIHLATRSEPGDHEIVLDFFAGSASTAHAVLDKNKEDASRRRFVMVQLPEHIVEKRTLDNGSRLDTIADIGKERIRRVIKRIESEQVEKAREAKEKLPGTTEAAPDLDLGFKVFKLDASSIHPWDADFDNLEETLFNSVENIKPDRSEADVLYELLLKYGLDLAVAIEERQIADKAVFIIGAGALIVCLAADISLDVVEGIAALKEELQPEVMRVVFKDSGFKDDVVKTNTVQILRQAGIEDVKSL